MKKITLFLLSLVAVSVNGQNEPKKTENISFVNTFQFTIGFTNLAPNKSMMGDAHQEAFPLITGRLGVFNYSRWGLGLHASVHRMRVKDIQYFGNFNKTTAFTIGPYLSYYQPISSESLLEPYISYDYTDYNSSGYDKELSSESDGLGLGLDYEHKISTKTYITLGLKYNINKMRTLTNPEWEKYIINYNFLTAKIGFTFSNNRL